MQLSGITGGSALPLIPVILRQRNVHGPSPGTFPQIQAPSVPVWSCFQADTLAGGGQGTAEGYATAVLQGPVCSQVVPAMFQGNCISHNSQAAQSTLVEVFKQTMPLEGDDSITICMKIQRRLCLT